jgi:hypothetical protein
VHYVEKKKKKKRAIIYAVCLFIVVCEQGYCELGQPQITTATNTLQGRDEILCKSAANISRYMYGKWAIHIL